jgi:hypothetical protein
MELLLIRTYAPGGTDGTILHDGQHVVYTIELPWKDNRTGVSCIPEGRYRLVRSVTSTTGPGRGLQSRAALQQLTGLVFAAIDRKKPIFITIKSDSHEPGSTINGPRAGLL